MKRLLHPSFIVCVLIYILVRVLKVAAVNLPDIIQYHLSDLVCMPIVLTICLVGVRYSKKLPDFELSIVMILGMAAFYSIVFEWMLPNLNAKFTGDWWDVLAYLIGSMFYFIIFYPSKKKVDAIQQ